MSADASPKGFYSPGLLALHQASRLAATEIAAALQRVVPPGFRGRISVVVDNGLVRAQDVAVEVRPEQQRNAMKP